MKKSTVKTIIRTFLLVLCGTALGINVYLANANSLARNKLPMPFGYGAAVVLSGSMEPELSVDDLIIVKAEDEYAERDVVVYQDGEILVVHRIIGKDGDSIITKGDANNAPDEPIEPSRINGKVVFCVPSVGKIVDFMKSPIGTVLIIAAAVALVEVPRRLEKKKDDEERQKIIDEIEKIKESVKK